VSKVEKMVVDFVPGGGTLSSVWTCITDLETLVLATHGSGDEQVTLKVTDEKGE
jgi:hypothetical protein